MATKDQFRRLLLKVYKQEGPRDGNRGLTVVPPAEYAALTRTQVDKMWDFSDRHLMHAIAKALAR